MKNLIIIPLVFVCLFAKAQLKDVEIIWGEPYKSKKTIVTDIITTEGGDIYAIKQNLGVFNQDIFLEQYRDLSPYKSTEIQFDNSERADIFKNVINVDNDLWMLEFKTAYDYTSLYAQFVDKSSLTPIGERVEIFHLPLERKLRYSNGGFDYAISKDKKRTAFIIQYPGDRSGTATLGYQLRNENFDIVYEHDINLECEKEAVEIAGLDVANNGSSYGLIKIYDKKKLNNDRRNASFQYHIIGCNEKGNHINLPVKLDEGMNIQNMHFELAANGDIYIGGFYGTSCCTIDGSFFIKVDGKTNEQTTYNTKAFSLDFITEGLSDKKQNQVERRAEKGEAIGFDNVDFRDFIVRQDGGVVLIGEFYAVNINNNTEAAGGNPNGTHFNYKDIIVVSIDPKGQIEWSKKILKRQLTTDDGGFMSSFVLAVNGDNLYFVFNDHEANLTVKDANELKTYDRNMNNSIVTMVSLDGKGEMTREQVISQRELGLEIRPQSCAQVSSNELILFGLKRNENQFAKVVFNH